MKREMVLKNMLVTALALLVLAVVAVIVTDYFADRQQADSIVKMSYAFKNSFEFREDNDYEKYTELPDSLKGGFRLTVLDENGNVLGDSAKDAADMETHADRQEFLQALENGTSEVVTRYSETFKYKMTYYAFRVTDGEQTAVIRLAARAQDINDYALSMVPVLFVLILTVYFLSMLVTVNVNNSVLKAFKTVETNLNLINSGTYSKVMPTFKHEEINRAIVGLNDIQEKINGNIRSLTAQTQKLDSVLESAEQGIIALGSDMDVLLINSFAKAIFKIRGGITGKHILFTGCDKTFYDSLTSCISNYGGVFEYAAEDKVYQVKVNTNVASKDIEAVVVLSDITAIKRMERLRSDFFANASHELKTPLTGIKGFAELIQNESETDTIKKYNSFILKDSERMLTLIEDMLKLSHLDTRAEWGKKEKIDLAALAREVSGSLSATARSKKVAIELEGGARIYAVREDMHELIENLLSNAVRYNKEGGSVRVTLSEDGETKITVADTGIGIDKEHHERIFERFYRVDKGRSKQSGGTGLGLSIVKHIVSLYGGHIALDSRVGECTTITVTL